MTEALPPFSKYRSLFWPVHTRELKKLIPMLLIFMSTAFGYNVLRSIKDALVITAADSGVEVIPFIKVWILLPASILLTWVYMRLSNRIQQIYVVYIMLGGILAFFILFICLLYPRSEEIHLSTAAEYLSRWLPSGFKGFINMIRYWSFSIFFAMAELWSNIVLSILCWGFVNQITNFEEARRFYGILGIAINISGILAGQISIAVMAQSSCWLPIDFRGNPWGPSLTNLTIMIVIAGFLALSMFAYLNKTAQKNTMERNQQIPPQSDTEKQGKKLSIRASFRYLLSSRYALCLAAIVISYNMVINLSEILWKHQVKELYSNPADYTLFMNKITTWSSVAATVASCIVFGNIIRIFGWTTTALIPPSIVLFTSLGFFAFLLANNNLILPMIGISSLHMSVVFGTIQNCSSRIVKYTIFEETKEIAFTPLALEEKITGKAAIDGICNRLGRSGGSLLYQFLLITFSTMTACIPYLAIVLFAMIAVWIVSVKSLGKHFSNQHQQHFSTRIQN